MEHFGALTTSTQDGNSDGRKSVMEQIKLLEPDLTDLQALAGIIVVCCCIVEQVTWCHTRPHSSTLDVVWHICQLGAYRANCHRAQKTPYGRFQGFDPKCKETLCFELKC